MNAEKLVNEKIFGAWSVKGLYLWINTIRKGLKNRKLPLSKRLWCLHHGFNPATMLTYGEQYLKENYADFLSEKQYYRMHPINGPYTIWIDDKLTTKNCFSKYNDYLPMYYFEITNHEILRLSDCQKTYSCTSDGIIDCLNDEKVLTLKRLVGSGGVGFYRLECIDGEYFVTGQKKTREELKAFLNSLNGYLVMEFITNHKDIRKIWHGSTNTMRMLWGRIGNDFILMRSFLRFGNSKSNGVDNAHMGGIETIIDEETGNVLFTVQANELGQLLKIDKHPDSGEPFPDKIPFWKEAVSLTRQIMTDYPQLKYMGFDVVVTDNGLKIIEINSLSGLTAAQAKEPLLKDKKTLAVYQSFGLK